MVQNRPCIGGVIVLVIIVVLSFYYTNSRLSKNEVVNPAQDIDHYLSKPPAKWTRPILPEHMLNVSQNDRQLIQHIREKWIIPPSNRPRLLKNPTLVHYSQSRQSQMVDQIFFSKTNGFYVECGAADGEKLSNSLFFEKSRNWSGVLIEGYMPWFQELLKLHRRAYSVGSCLSGVKKPVRTRFTNIGYGGGLIDYMEQSHLKRFGGVERMEKKTNTMQCLPLYSILTAIGVNHVDYFSLDIEGAELEVIKTLPLDEITVDVFTIEYVVGTNATGADSQKKLKDIKDYLVGQHGYEVFHVNPLDDVFLKKKGI
jgi:hypothetical protein